MEAASSNDPPLPAEQALRLFRCSVLHCGKLFNRKEHLRRHIKSHSPNPQHECRICGRRYARSDVLKRHMENHPLNPRGRQPRTTPCRGCVERKTRCNGSTPCQACTRASTECIRPGVYWMANEDADAEVVTATEDRLSPKGLASDGSNGPSRQPQPQPGPAGTRTETETASVHFARQNIPPVPPDILATASSEQSGALLALDSAAQYAWLADGLDLYQQDEQGPDHMLPAGFTDSAPPLHGTDLNTSVQSTAPIHSGHQSLEMQSSHNLSLHVSGVDGSHMSNGLATMLGSGISSGDAHVSYSLYNMLSARSTRMYDTMHDLQLQLHDTQTTERLVESYFRDVHPCWPILHKPTFSIAKCSPILKQSVLMLGSLAGNGSEHLSLAPRAVEIIMASRNLVQEQIPLETLQAMLLCLVYHITYRGRDEEVFGALRLHGFLVAALRCQQVFSGMPDIEVEEQPVEQDAFRLWLAHEAHNRLAFSCLRVDAYLSILLDQPPSVRYLELVIPLPKLARLWSARTAEERSRLQWSTPAGRERVLFSNIVRDSLEEESGTRLCYPLNGLDYHLGLCALQAGVWEAAHEAHSFSSDELSTRLGPGKPIFVWRSHLDYWRRSMVENGRFSCSDSGGGRDSSASDDEEEAPFAPMTLILWHVSCMKMLSPIANLQASAALSSRNKRLSVAAAVPSANLAQHFDGCARIQSWVASRCARVSCWHAAQICRVIRHEAADPRTAHRLRLNPLACHGLYMSAVVVVSYAFYFQSCGGCVVDAAGLLPVTDLFSAAEDDEALQAWWDTGRGYGVWGPNQIPLCRCQMDDLVSWLRAELASLGDMETSFAAFTEKLKRD